MLLLLNFVLVIILLSVTKLPIHTVRSAETAENATTQHGDGELDGLKEVFYRNLMADLRMESGENVALTPELESRMEERMQSFLRATNGSSWVRTRRQVVQGEGERQRKHSAEIDADTADGKWKIVFLLHYNKFITYKYSKNTSQTFKTTIF